MVRLYDDITEDVDGSPELAYRLLGLQSKDDVVVFMICVSFAMLAVLAMALCAQSYMHLAQKRQAAKWSTCTMDPPYVLWKTRSIYACFLSHYKLGELARAKSCEICSRNPYTQRRIVRLALAEAASDARYMHDMLRKMLRAPVFLGEEARVIATTQGVVQLRLCSASGG